MADREEKPSFRPKADRRQPPRRVSARVNIDCLTTEADIRPNNFDAEHSILPCSHLSMTAWLSICAARLNVLFEGEAGAIEAVLLRLEPHFRRPVVWNAPEEPLTLPTGGGTLVLQSVAALAANDQVRLCEWLTNAGEQAQVISTSATALFPLVERGLFDATLYYRLNTVLFDVSNQQPPDRPRTPAERLH